MNLISLTHFSIVTFALNISDRVCQVIRRPSNNSSKCTWDRKYFRLFSIERDLIPNEFQTFVEFLFTDDAMHSC